MSNDKVPPFPQNLQDQLDQAAHHLPDVTVASLLQLLLDAAFRAERKSFLHQHPDDKANGFYNRQLQLGAIPLHCSVPRTRSGSFRPQLLPPPWQRAFPEDRQRLLLALLAGSRSLEAARRSLAQLGLTASSSDLDAIADELLGEFDLLNNSSLPQDLLALFLDAKTISVRDNNRVQPSTLYLAVGLLRDGRKRILACHDRHGRESLDGWRDLFKDLLDRGLRRVLIAIHDDFPGLLRLSQGFFPQADVQLCFVHMQRNAARHLTRSDNLLFQQRLRAIKNSYDPEKAAAEFDDLCRLFQDAAPNFIRELRRKKDHYLAFLRYPEPIRRSLSTTNTVEAVNSVLENLRRNSGGYFQSPRISRIKLALAVRNLHDGRWQRPASNTARALHDLNRLFQLRYELQEP